MKTREPRFIQLQCYLKALSMINDRQNGATLREIADRWNVTPERVRQLIYAVRPEMKGNLRVRRHTNITS
jgi:DNA-directed RNA polymerase sigma subunit (sigma70/sigma32)